VTITPLELCERIGNARLKAVLACFSWSTD